MYVELMSLRIGISWVSRCSLLTPRTLPCRAYDSLQVPFKRPRSRATGWRGGRHAARNQITQAAGVIANTVIDLVGTIGQQILDKLNPARRLRVNARTVKRAISKYNARGPNIERRTYQATINILAGPALTNGPEP
jgi:hypothetical protein